MAELTPEPEMSALPGLAEIRPMTLFVNVDFNALLESRSEQETFELLGKLKDLLA